jgi:hypothetical protein
MLGYWRWVLRWELQDGVERWVESWEWYVPDYR